MVVLGHGGISHSLEVAKTVLEVADVAWTAIEHHHHHHHQDHATVEDRQNGSSEEELESLRSENHRLRSLLEQNLKLLEHLSQSPSLLKDCPPDLYVRLIATVNSKSFLTQLESLHQASTDGTINIFPFKEATGSLVSSIKIAVSDLHTAETLVNLDLEEPSWWVWVTDEMVPSNVEELSRIDNESYLIVSEEHVVDGVANFLARCILSNPNAKGLAPEEMQKNVSRALSGMNKVEKMINIWEAGKLFYALSTWGLAVAGLYRHRGILKVAAKGVHATGKVVLRAL
ncbi:hypothetical protein HHK36_007806 [Tetracentron sinense]|uniref:Uncharacterized protein n=1 Tax=Tetracentron sinense TaxID=13715 RepID=A0A834ZDF6_TETSI|nr:hypothetical protein HHK36_007806 [Tetracentron sinense]